MGGWWGDNNKTTKRPADRTKQDLHWEDGHRLKATSHEEGAIRVTAAGALVISGFSDCYNGLLGKRKQRQGCSPTPVLPPTRLKSKETKKKGRKYPSWPLVMVAWMGTLTWMLYALLISLEISRQKLRLTSQDQRLIKPRGVGREGMANPLTTHQSGDGHLDSLRDDEAN